MSSKQWTCGVCTFVNLKNINKCEVCEALKPPTDAAPAIAASSPAPAAAAAVEPVASAGGDAADVRVEVVTKKKPVATAAPAIGDSKSPPASATVTGASGDDSKSAAAADSAPVATTALARQSTADSDGVGSPDGLTRQSSTASGDGGGWDDLEVDDSAASGGSGSALATAKAAGLITGGKAGAAASASSSILASSLLKEPVKLKVQGDCEEVNMIDRFAAKVDFMGGGKIRVWLAIDIRNLNINNEQLRAWYCNPAQHIVAQMEFTPYYFEGSERPTVSIVGQSYGFSGPPTKFGLSWPLEDRIRTQFLSKIPARNEPAGFTVRDVNALMDLSGQSAVVSIRALRKCKKGLNEAATLLSDPKQLQTLLADQKAATASWTFQTYQAPDSKGGDTKDSKSGGKKKGGKSGSSSSSSGGGSTESQIEQLMKTFDVSYPVAVMALELEGTADAAAALLTNKDAISQLEAICDSGDGPKAGSGGGGGKAGGSRVGLEALLSEHNYLVRLLLFLENKLLHCSERCMICDRVLDFHGYKPSICTAEVCVMGYSELSLGFDLGKEIKEQPAVVDLLISLLVCSISANRLLFVTPSGVRAKDAKGQDIDLGSEENINMARLNQCLANCPPVPEMRKMVDKGTLLAELNKLDPLLYPLLRWILTSNRAHIRQLTSAENMKDLKTPYQFVLLSSNPDREKKFQSLRKGASVSEYTRTHHGKTQGTGKTLTGSCWAWHGSGAGNWHSILRTGLKNMSNTKFMTHGAAAGSGIYMATDSGTSLGYCGQPAGWANSAIGSSFLALAICEVVNQSHLSGNVYVVPNEDTVVTRFLIVYPNGTNSGVGVDGSQQQSYPAQSVSVSKLNIPKLV